MGFFLDAGGVRSVERMLAWRSRRAKQSARGAGWLHEDRPVARDGWEQVEEHTVPGLAVYLVPDREASTASEGTRSTPGTTPLFRDDRGVPGVDGDRPEAKAASDQLRLDFNRNPEHPNQHSLIEDGRLEPALEES